MVGPISKNSNYMAPNFISEVNNLLGYRVLPKNQKLGNSILGAGAYGESGIGGGAIWFSKSQSIDIYNKKLSKNTPF